MAKNMATLDRWIRALIIAPLAVLAAYLVGASTVGGVVLLVFALVMLVTALVGFCPIYAVLGLRTNAAK